MHDLRIETELAQQLDGLGTASQQGLSPDIDQVAGDLRPGQLPADLGGLLQDHDTGTGSRPEDFPGRGQAGDPASHHDHDRRPAGFPAGEIT
jgi:hypothetical protein